jgi:hypothetical protein
MSKKAKRKTVSIKSLLDHVNHFNRTSADCWKEQREGQNVLLEKILMDAGAYCGFSHLSASEIHDDAMSVGIRERREDGSWNFDDTDPTRICYGEARGL